MATNTQDYTGIQKAAILLIALGPERSADIFKHLKEDEIEELTLEIANTRSVSPQVQFLMNFTRYVLHSSILQKAVLDMRKSYWIRHLVRTGQRKLSQNLQRPCRYVRLNLYGKQIQASY